MEFRMFSNRKPCTLSPAILLLVLLLSLKFGSGQRTALDEIFSPLVRPFRLLGWEISGRTGDMENVRSFRKIGKTQKATGRSFSSLCDPKNGPGRRSDTRPTSVHKLTPGDIDIVGALGDSLTAGAGVFASNFLHLFVENRGAVWSIGGESTWDQYLTLPNILKEFNPNLYGYSLKDSLSTDRNSKFNVAELGAMSRDVPYEAKVLVKRFKADPKVNMTHDWKLVTLLIGNNDFCADVCYYPNPEKAIDWHEKNMVTTFRYLRDNVPRLMVNLVPSPNLIFLTRYVGLPAVCNSSLRFECPCIIGKSKKYLKKYEDLILKWIARDKEVASRDEFNTETFTINVQPFSQFRDIPKNKMGNTNLKYLSTDCFHLSQKAHAACANSLWNNMLEPDGQKSTKWRNVFEKFLCPTVEHPYLMTRENSKNITRSFD